MKFSLVAAAFALPCALAMPSEAGHGDTVLTRDNPKLNQYRSMDDCRKDKNILFHAAPSSGNCYNLDGQTGAFFYNTAGYLFSSDIGCNGVGAEGLRGAACREKGAYRSVMFR
ncbi:hypothetical protein GQ44DRAFT_725935 [Phaeosphaeriaceae sp. PMI808]|nr:hypothetical protein GQ44DRAFT_725935 [Phaeosphaeriaceae sp. PMI808]